MAITKTAINNDYSTLQSFLQSSGLFASVELGTDAVTMKDSDGNTIAIINTGTITAYANASNNASASYANGGSIKYAYKCANGIMLEIKSTNITLGACISVSKTNNNKIAFIFSTGLAAMPNRYGNYHCVAWGDGEISANTISGKTSEQTLMCPFCTNAIMGETSYTPNAFWMPFGQYYNMGYGTLTDGSSEFLTNGYWCIKDTAES